MEEKVYHDLTFSQKIMFYLLDHCPQKNVTNIGISIWLPDELKIDALKEAVYLSVKRMDALRMQLTKVNGEVKQFISDEDVVDLECKDFSKYSSEKIDKILTKWTSSNIKYTDCPLYKFYLIKGPDNFTVLYVLVNHIVMDEWALTVLAKDLLSTYIALKNHEELPQPPASFVECLAEEYKYQGSRRELKDFEYWKNQFAVKPKFAAIDLKSVGAEYRKPPIIFKSKLKTIHLSKEHTKKIKEYCKSNRISPQILFLIGTQTYFYALNETNESLVNFVMARRSDNKRKEAGGMFANALPFKVECPAGLTFKECCEKVTTDQYGLFRHGDFPYPTVLKYVDEKFNPGKKGRFWYTDMMFTYQMGAVKLKEDLHYFVKNHSNGSCTRALYLTIMDVEDNGELDFLFEYNTAIVKEEIVDKIYNVMLAVVDIGIEEPEIKMSDLINKMKQKFFNN